MGGPYDGNPRVDPGLWIHLAMTVGTLCGAFNVRELHREHDGSFGLVMPRPDPT